MSFLVVKKIPETEETAIYDSKEEKQLFKSDSAQEAIQWAIDHHCEIRIQTGCYELTENFKRTEGKRIIGEPWEKKKR